MLFSGQFFCADVNDGRIRKDLRKARKCARKAKK